MSKIEINFFLKKKFIDSKNFFLSTIFFDSLKFACWPNACTPLSVLPAPAILTLVLNIFFNTFSIVA